MRPPNYKLILNNHKTNRGRTITRTSEMIWKIDQNIQNSSDIIQINGTMIKRTHSIETWFFEGLINFFGFDTELSGKMDVDEELPEIFTLTLEVNDGFSILYIISIQSDYKSDFSRLIFDKDIECHSEETGNIIGTPEQIKKLSLFLTNQIIPPLNKLSI